MRFKNIFSIILIMICLFVFSSCYFLKTNDKGQKLYCSANGYYYEYSLVSFEEDEDFFYIKYSVNFTKLDNTYLKNSYIGTPWVNIKPVKIKINDSSYDYRENINIQDYFNEVTIFIDKIEFFNSKKEINFVDEYEERYKIYFESDSYNFSIFYYFSYDYTSVPKSIRDEVVVD